MCIQMCVCVGSLPITHFNSFHFIFYHSVCPLALALNPSNSHFPLLCVCFIVCVLIFIDVTFGTSVSNVRN